MQRQDIPLLPQRVVREMVVNALMHRDYHLHEPIQIIRYSNRIEISNPGFSLKPEDELGEARSRLRNPVLASVMYDLSFAETKGTGVRVMRRLLKEAGLSAPLFTSRRGADTFRGTFLFHHFLSDEDLHWLEQFKALELSDEQKMALLFAREQGAIDNAAFRDINVSDTLTASQQLVKLRQLDLLRKGGRGSATYYLPGPAFPDMFRKQKVGQPNDGEPQDVDHLGQDVDHLVQDVDHLGEHKDQPTTDIERLKAYLPSALAQALPGERRKPGRQEARKRLLQLCKYHPFTAEQLAILMGGRKKRHLVSTYLAPLVSEKLLELTYPDVKNHPRQAYRTSEAGTRWLEENKQ